MSKNTGDGELAKALRTIDIVDELIHSITRLHIPDYPEATIAINKIDNLIAQEANKAVTEALSRVEAWHGGDLGYRLSEAESISLDDRIAQLTKEKESSDV